MIITANMPKSDMKNGNVTNWHLGSLAYPGDREESASHHVLFTIHTQTWNIVRQHRKSCSEVVIWSEERWSRSRISWFLEIALDHSRCTGDASWWLLMVPSGTWNALVLILRCIKNRHVSCWNPRPPFSQGWFCDLEETNDIHGLLTHCSSFPRWHFYSWSHFKIW